jgi:hypothetical protein
MIFIWPGYTKWIKWCVNFVFPLPFYIAEIFHLFGMSLVDSIKTLFFITMPLSMIGMYKLVYTIKKDRLISLLASVVYAYAPYRAVDLYVRGAIGEVLSFVFFPFIVWTIINTESSNSIRWPILGGLMIGGLVLTHNIAAYMFIPMAVILGILLLLQTNAKRKLIQNYLLMIIVGLLVSAYFWLPAILDSSLMKYDTVFNYLDHFPTIIQLLKPHWGYGASVPGPYDGMSFFIGVANLLAVIFGLLFIVRKGIHSLEGTVVVWALIVFGISFAMMNYRSSFLWEVVPLVKYFQFPWRFLMLSILSSAVLIMTLDNFRYAKIVQVAVLGLTLVISFHYFRPEDFLGRQDSYYINKYIPTPVASSEYRLTQEEYLRLPKNTQMRPSDSFPAITPMNNVNLSQRGDLNLQAEFNNPDSQVFSYNKYQFPGWVGSIDGKDLVLQTGQPYGQIAFTVPPGRHHITISFQETLLKLLLDWLSLVVFIGSLILLSPIKTKIPIAVFKR